MVNPREIEQLIIVLRNLIRHALELHRRGEKLILTIHAQMLYVVQKRIEVARCRNQVALCKRLFAVARRFFEEIQPDKTLLAPVSHRIVERILLRCDNVNLLRIVARIGKYTVNRRQLLTGQAVCLDADKNGIRAVNIVLRNVGTVFYRVIQTRRVNKNNALGERQILERNLDFLYEIMRCEFPLSALLCCPTR